MHAGEMAHPPPQHATAHKASSPAHSILWIKEQDIRLSSALAQTVCANRFGEPVPMPDKRFAVFVEIVCERVVAALLPDRVLQMEAAMPATCGQAIDVPEIVFVAVFEPIQADMMLLPGANVSTHVPKFENVERASAFVLEPTQMPKGAEAGEKVHAFALLFPAATTITAPARLAPSTASLEA